MTVSYCVFGASSMPNAWRASVGSVSRQSVLRYSRKSPVTNGVPKSAAPPGACPHLQLLQA